MSSHDWQSKDGKHGCDGSNGMIGGKGGDGGETNKPFGIGGNGGSGGGGFFGGDGGNGGASYGPNGIGGKGGDGGNGGFTPWMRSIKNNIFSYMPTQRKPENENKKSDIADNESFRETDQDPPRCFKRPERERVLEK
uniref:Glycine-rich protein n=1 Tax=Panagrolaimus sp. JU765 TaxID=591449 RepID=A0AC34RLK1_9BILA